MDSTYATRKPSNGKLAPGPKSSILLGSLSGFRIDPARFLMNLFNEYGNTVRFKLGPYLFHLSVHPDHVKYILQENNRNFSKERVPLFEVLKPTLGNGLLTSTGNFWLRQRRIAQPAFHRQGLASLVNLMVDTTSKMLGKWDSIAHLKQPLNINVEMMQLTLQIVAESLLGTSVVKEKAHAVDSSLKVIMEDQVYRVTHPFTTFPLSVPTPRNRRFHKALGVIDSIIFKTISDRREETSHHFEDLLSTMMEAKDEETGESMDNNQLRDEIITFFLAGHETTANAMTWTWYLLSKNPLVEKKLYQEINSVLGDRAPKFEDLNQLKYTKRVILESMRLYPPAWLTARRAVEKDEIDGFSVPAGSFVFLSQYVTHRHPSFWENPEGFDPDRFEESKIQGQHRFAYFPFGGGPHLCIGNNFAMMEAQIILAMVVQRYSLYLVQGHPVELEPLVTLRPKYGMAMTVHSR